MSTEAPAGPNRVTLDWLKRHRGQDIIITRGKDLWYGELVRWDLFSVLIRDARGEVLIKQAPGMDFRSAEGETDG